MLCPFTARHRNSQPTCPPLIVLREGIAFGKKGYPESTRESYLAGRGANDSPPRGGFDGQVRVSQLRQRRMGRVPQGSHVHGGQSREGREDRIRAAIGRR